MSYQDQKAMKKPNQEKKNTRPYWLTGFKTGIDLAFLLIGFSSGAFQRALMENMIDRSFCPACVYNSSRDNPASTEPAVLFKYCRPYHDALGAQRLFSEQEVQP